MGMKGTIPTCIVLTCVFHIHMSENHCTTPHLRNLSDSKAERGWVCVCVGGEVRFMGLQLSLINLVFLFSHVMPKINNKSLVNSDTFDF